jgi:DNA-binding response OmpR family regulator
VPAQPEPQGSAASVLVVAADATIEALARELVRHAGYRALGDSTGGAAGESVRRSRPRFLLLDVALPSDVVRSCLGAAAEVQAVPVLTSSAGSPSELAELARLARCSYFALPGGPRLLARVLESASQRATSTPTIDLPPSDLPAAARRAWRIPPRLSPLVARRDADDEGVGRSLSQ